MYLVARTFWRRGPLQCPRRMGMWEGSGSASERWAVELGSPETPGTFVPWGTGKPSLLFTSHLWWRTALPYEVPRMSTSLHVDHACTCSQERSQVASAGVWVGTRSGILHQSRKYSLNLAEGYDVFFQGLPSMTACCSWQVP